MNKILVSLVAMMFLVVPMAFGVTIDDTNADTQDGTDVGSVDTFIAATGSLSQQGGSSVLAEQNWANSVLGANTVTFIPNAKTEEVPYYDTDNNNVFAFSLGSPAVEYFIIKNSNWWALFKNVDNMFWGVFDTTAQNLSGDNFPSGNLNLPSDDYEISHVTRFNAVPVPEPSTLLLFGAGIAGLALYRRKRS